MFAVNFFIKAQINVPTALGYLQRSERMLDAGNYQGCIDQLSAIDTTVLDDANRQRVAWLRIRAAYVGAFENAAFLIQNYINTYPASPHRSEALLMLGNVTLRTSAADAYKIYKKISPADLDDEDAADLNYHTAYAQLRLGEFGSAATRFKSLTTNPVYSGLSGFYLGYIAYSDGDYSKAKPLFEAADRSKLPGLTADYYLAQIYYADGDFAEAFECANKLVQSPVEDVMMTAEANRIAGESLFALGKKHESVPYLQRYVDMIETPELSALYILGMSEYENGNYAVAVEYLEPVTASDNAMGQSAYLYVGEALICLGKKDAALMAFNNALRMEYDIEVQDAAFYNYAVAKFGGANIPFGSSVATFEEYLRRYPNGSYASRVQEYLVTGYLTERNYESALESIKRMNNPGPRVLAAKQQILYTLGTRLLVTGDDKTALRYLEEASKLDSYSKEIAIQNQLSLGEAYYKLKNYPAAEAALNTYLSQASRSDVNRPLAYYDLGYVNFATKNHDKAAVNFQKFVDNPGVLGSVAVADAMNRIADTHFYAGQFDKARAFYIDAYATMPSVGDYPLFQQGIIHGYQREYKDKINVLVSLLERFPSSSLVPEAMLEMTEGYLRLGRNEDAIATYRRLIETHPTTEQGRRAYVQLALTQINVGDRKGAIETYRQVIKLYPTSDEAHLATEELQRVSAEDGTLAQFSEFLASVENAPKLDISESDRLTFEAAEQSYLASQTTARLESYINEYPNGAYQANAYALLMEAAQNAGNTLDALTFSTTIVERFPDKRMAETALIVKARSEHSLGRGSDALNSWTALENRASDPATLNLARAGIMRVARDLADNQRVITAADALLASSTLGSEDRNEAVFSKALAQSLSGDIAAAREGWGQIAEYTDDLYGAKSAYYLAESYFEEKNFTKARLLTDALIDSATPHSYWLARAFILLSDILAAENKKFEAREYLRSLKENYPGNETDIFQMIDSRLSNLQ